MADRRGISVRLSPAVHDQLKQAALDREVSINFLVSLAVEDMLDRLVSVEELKAALLKPRED